MLAIYDCETAVLSVQESRNSCVITLQLITLQVHVSTQNADVTRSSSARFHVSLKIRKNYQNVEE